MRVIYFALPLLLSYLSYTFVSNVLQSRALVTITSPTPPFFLPSTSNNAATVPPTSLTVTSYTIDSVVSSFMSVFSTAYLFPPSWLRLISPFHAPLRGTDLQYGAIDAVYTWVNGSDPVWAASKHAYTPPAPPSSFNSTDTTNTTDANSTLTNATNDSR